MSVDSKAYASLYKRADGKIDEIIREIEKVTEQAKQNFAIRQWPLYYVEWK